MIRTALIIAHGQPAAPDRAEAALAALAGKVAPLLPGWQIGSATLAAPDALTRAITALGPQGRAYPLFMAGGWFTRSHLPAKLAAAGGPDWQVLEPLGCDPAIHDLTLDLARASNATSLILAAHGSSRSPAPSDIAQHLADRITEEAGIPSQAAFIDQDPQLAHLDNTDPTAACLPYFAAEGGHVTEDIPAALAMSGFQGRLLPALGLAPDIPAIIARAILSGTPVCAQSCRWSRTIGPSGRSSDGRQISQISTVRQGSVSK